MDDGKFLHMCCFAHILILIVKDGLEQLKDANFFLWYSLSTRQPHQKSLRSLRR